MVVESKRASLALAATVALLLGACAAPLLVPTQHAESTHSADEPCSVDLRLAGMMADIVSNVLLRSESPGVKQPEAEARTFLQNAESRYASGDELLRAAARHFSIDEATLALEVELFRHTNCAHAKPARGDQSEVGDVGDVVELSAFARDVTLHVVLHELGHGLIREFDLPVLGNEEAMADAFATHYLTTYLPDRAVDVLTARTTSLMIEAREVPRDQWTVVGEHDNDARRAFQIAALAVSADPARDGKYDALAKQVGMSDEDIRKAKDYGAEIHRSWRRSLESLWMPKGLHSREARVVCDPENKSFTQTAAVDLVAELESIVTRFDWHSQVTIRFAPGEGGAAWSRSQRMITVHNQYLRRFVEQGKAAGLSK